MSKKAKNRVISGDLALDANMNMSSFRELGA